MWSKCWVNQYISRMNRYCVNKSQEVVEILMEIPRKKVPAGTEIRTSNFLTQILFALKSHLPYTILPFWWLHFKWPVLWATTLQWSPASCLLHSPDSRVNYHRCTDELTKSCVKPCHVNKLVSIRIKSFFPTIRTEGYGFSKGFLTGLRKSKNPLIKSCSMKLKSNIIFFLTVSQDQQFSNVIRTYLLISER